MYMISEQRKSGNSVQFATSLFEPKKSHLQKKLNFIKKIIVSPEVVINQL